MNRVDRLMGYLLLFQSRGLMRAQDFSEKFEISERTVYRDIQALCEVGVPIMAAPGEGYRLMEGYYLPPITLAPDEARALSLAVSMLMGLSQPGPTRSAAQSALEKIRTVLPAATLKQLEALQAVMRFYGSPGAALNFDDQTFLTLQEAIHQHRVVHLRYYGRVANEVTERDVEPLALIFYDKIWMLVGYCRLRQDQRYFRLDRIDALKTCEETFTPREDIDYLAYNPESEVVVRFDASVVRWVKERQHFGFEREEHTQGGDVIMTYKIRDLISIAHWLLGWGDQFKVLEPLKLRQYLAKTAAQITVRHQAAQ